MFEAHVDTDHDNERVVVVLEAGSCWSLIVAETMKAAPNALVLAQAPGESPAVFAARVACRLGRLTAEHGRVVRAATLCTGIGEGTVLAESRRRITEALAQGITAGSRVIVTPGDRPKWIDGRSTSRPGVTGAMAP